MPSWRLDQEKRLAPGPLERELAQPITLHAAASVPRLNALGTTSTRFTGLPLPSGSLTWLQGDPPLAKPHAHHVGRWSAVSSWYQQSRSPGSRAEGSQPCDRSLDPPLGLED